MAKVCLEKYGDLGRLIKDEKYYEPPEVDRSKYPLSDDKDPDGINKMLLQEALKARQKAVLKMANERASFYGFVLNKLSNESLDELKRHEKYSTFDPALDVLELWKALQ
jgi:hypothetical protein